MDETRKPNSTLVGVHASIQVDSYLAHELQIARVVQHYHAFTKRRCGRHGIAHHVRVGMRQHLTAACLKGHC